MKGKISVVLILVLLLLGISAQAREKKNVPRDKDVEAALKDAGPGHFPEDMKIYKVGSIEAGETYYHVFCGQLKKGGYRVIIMDNNGKYLGYYFSEYEPTDYEEGAVLLDDGSSDYFTLPIGKKGPTDKVYIDGVLTKFVKNPKNTSNAKNSVESKTSGTVTAVTTEKKPAKPEYREWTITHHGRKVRVRAIYVKTVVGNVFLKSESNGVTKPFPLSALSKEDQAYVKQFTNK